MKRIFAVTLLLLLCVNPVIFAQQEQVSDIITTEKVGRIISTLSSDEMQGRRAFTPGSEKAADFIAGQFERAGLEYLNGLDSYRQNFTVYLLQPKSKMLTLNGKKISDDHFFYVTRHASISWSDLSSVETHTISESDNFQQAFSKINQSKTNIVTLVDPAHKDIFSRYGNYFDRNVRQFSINEGTTKLFILSDTVELQTGSFTASKEVAEQQGFNVAGKIQGSSKKDEFVLFSAHYDHLGILTPVEGDSIANGADDDASGTTAVMALAEYFKKMGPHTRTLVFVAFTAEEMGGYGSRYFSLHMNPDQVVGMFNIEMIGKPSKFGPNTAFMTGFDMTDMGKILQQDLKETPYMVYPDPYPDQNLFFRSDNATLARQGVPAHTISSAEIDKDTLYHTVNDELKSLDLNHLTNMIRAIALSSKSIISGKETPTRINPEQLD